MAAAAPQMTHNTPDKFIKSQAWTLSVTLHFALAAALVAFARFGSLAPACTDFAPGESEVAISHVGLLTAEQEARLTRPSRAADPAPVALEPEPIPAEPVAPEAIVQSLAAEPSPDAAATGQAPQPVTLEAQASPTSSSPTRAPVALASSTTSSPVANTSQALTAGAAGPIGSADGDAQSHAPSESAPGTSAPTSGSGDTTGDVEFGATVRNLLRPRYPADARRANEQGTVLLEVEVHADGTVGSIRVLSDAGHPRLVTAALSALHDATFKPAQRDGKPVGSVLRIPFRFVIRD